MSKKIFLIEEQHSESNKLAPLFEGQGHTVVVFDGNLIEPATFLAEADFFKPGLVVLNYQTHFQAGLNLCRNLKKSVPALQPPLLIYSQADDLNSMVQAYEAGADYYVTRNSDSESVLQSLVEILLIPVTRPGKIGVPAQPRLVKSNF